jgi:signal peptidase I
VSSPSTTPVQPGAPDSGPPEGPPDGPPDKERNSTRTLIEWVAVIGGALIVALVIKTFLIQAFYIPSGSMEPTLDIGDRVLVNKLSYRVHDVHRGDLVVFERPEGEGGDIRDLIKRVIGLGGETIEGRDGHIVIDGRVLSEPYLPEGVTTGDFEPVEIPEDQVWVMGDNRGDSRDSRSFGPIAEEDIVGRAFIRVWPVGDIGFL